MVDRWEHLRAFRRFAEQSKNDHTEHDLAGVLGWGYHDASKKLAAAMFCGGLVEFVRELELWYSYALYKREETRQRAISIVGRWLSL